MFHRSGLELCLRGPRSGPAGEVVKYVSFEIGKVRKETLLNGLCQSKEALQMPCSEIKLMLLEVQLWWYYLIRSDKISSDKNLLMEFTNGIVF